MVDESLREDRLHTGDWAVVADGEKALVLENVGDSSLLQFSVVQTRTQDNPATRDQGTDKPGRAHDGGVQQMSAMDDTDWHRLAKDRFADDLADMLYRHAHAGDFKRLALIAAPQVLGEVRKKLHAEVRARLIAEVPETLTNHPVDKIEAQVRDKLGNYEAQWTREPGRM